MPRRLGYQSRLSVVTLDQRMISKSSKYTSGMKCGYRHAKRRIDDHDDPILSRRNPQRRAAVYKERKTVG
jgi:hypothetical protein